MLLIMVMGIVMEIKNETLICMKPKSREGNLTAQRADAKMSEFLSFGVDVIITSRNVPDSD
jgi:hypothetical protein